jgi:hypothetical protein
MFILWQITTVYKLIVRDKEGIRGRCFPPISGCLRRQGLTSSIQQLVARSRPANIEFEGEE